VGGCFLKKPTSDSPMKGMRPFKSALYVVNFACQLNSQMPHHFPIGTL